MGQGTNFGDLAKAVGGIDIRTYPGSPEYLQDLALGRIDAALNDSLLIPYIVKQTKLPLKAGAPVGDVERSGIPFVKGNPQFKVAIDEALADLKADVSFAKISMKWLGAMSASRRLLRNKRCELRLPSQHDPPGHRRSVSMAQNQRGIEKWISPD